MSDPITLPWTPSFRVDGKRALVTGASRGIGLACAAGLAEAGAQVMLASRNRAELEVAAAAIHERGGKASVLAMDVTDLDSVENLIFSQGAYDILVNCAGMNNPQPLDSVTQTGFDAIIDLNVKAGFFLTQVVVRAMRRDGVAGTIVNISSQMGHVGAPNRSVYCASKHALEGMSKALAVELGEFGIRVNTVCPTFVMTDLSKKSLEDPEFQKHVLSKIRLGRLAEVEDIIGAVVFLASPAAAMITGTALVVDGGWTAH